MSDSAKLSIEVTGSNYGSDYSSLVVNGSVNLTGGSLSLTGDPSPGLAPGAPPLRRRQPRRERGERHFCGAGPGATLEFGGQDYEISYQADFNGIASGTFTGGNDIALMVVPEPYSVVSLVGGVGLLLGLTRRRGPWKKVPLS
ncbi:MAG: hypothetical protein WDN28_21370 [Chthoniobacter sp.]